MVSGVASRQKVMFTGGLLFGRISRVAGSGDIDVPTSLLVRLCLLLALFALPVSAAAAPNRVTELDIALSVSGARVEVDGVVVAEALEGQSLRHKVKAGSHVVKASKDGFEAVEQTIAVKRNQSVRVDVLLPVKPEPVKPEPTVTRAAPIRIAVYEMTVQGEFSKRVSSIVSEAVLAEVRKLDRASAVGMSEIAEMLSFEEQRQLLGCGDESCLAEIGGALGVDQLVSGSIGVIGDTTMFSLRRIDLSEAKVLGSVTKRFPSSTGEELLAAIGDGIEELFPDHPLRVGRTRGASVQAAQMLNPPPLPTWVFWSTAGASAAALAVAGVLGWSAKTGEAEYRAAADRSVNEPVSGAELKSIEKRAESDARFTNIALITAGSLALAAGIEALLTDWHGYAERSKVVRQVEISPAPNGVVALVRF